MKRIARVNCSELDKAGFEFGCDSKVCAVPNGLLGVPSPLSLQPEQQIHWRQCCNFHLPFAQGSWHLLLFSTQTHPSKFMGPVSHSQRTRHLLEETGANVINSAQSSAASVLMFPFLIKYLFSSGLNTNNYISSACK